MSSAIIAGLSLAALGYSGRYIIRSAPTVATKFNAILKDFPPITAEVNNLLLKMSHQKKFRGS